MLQLTAWNALQVEGFGANLYHYPLLTRLEDKEKWEVPEWWELKAQLPFGKPSGSPIEINEVESEKILRIYGKKIKPEQHCSGFISGVFLLLK